MAINYGLKGYLIQTLIAVLDALNPASDWTAISIEPHDDSEKVDLKIKYLDRTKVVQIKSSKNTFKHWEIKEWCKALSKSTEADYVKELLLVGRVVEKTRKVGCIDGVKIVVSDLYDEKHLIDIATHRLDKFYFHQGKPMVAAPIREHLVRALVCKFLESSVTGLEFTKDDFLKSMLKWVLDTEYWITHVNPWITFSEYPKLTSTNSVSHEVFKKAIHLLGWNAFSENISITIQDDTQNEEKTVRINFLGDFRSGTKSNTKEVIAIYCYDSPTYPESPIDTLREFYQSVKHSQSYLAEEGLLDTQDNITTRYHNILVWLSLDKDEEDKYYVLDCFNSEYGEPYMIKDNYYYVLDNAKLKFLISSIIDSKNYWQEELTTFLYPITEDNLSIEMIGHRGIEVPVEFINSSILPIVKEKNGQELICLFCADPF